MGPCASLELVIKRTFSARARNRTSIPRTAYWFLRATHQLCRWVFIYLVSREWSIHTNSKQRRWRASSTSVPLVVTATFLTMVWDAFDYASHWIVRSSHKGTRCRKAGFGVSRWAWRCDSLITGNRWAEDWLGSTEGRFTL